MQGLALLVTFGAMPKVTGPARPWSALVAIQSTATLLFAFMVRQAHHEREGCPSP